MTKQIKTDVIVKDAPKNNGKFVYLMNVPVYIERRVVFYNGITNQYILSLQGRCSIKDQGDQLEVTCKTGAKEYKKHFLGLSDNVTYFAEQLREVDVDTYRYKVIFKPESIIPNIDLETSANQ